MRHPALAVVILACASTLAAHAPSRRMVEVDGLRFHVRVAGETFRSTVPAVVFEAGARSTLESWDAVFDNVAAFAPVVAYDRPGNGSSTPDSEPSHPDRVAGHLKVLLTRLGLEPPYVLVGHSWGGPLIRVFAGRYPDSVAGLVYVDPTDMRSRAEDEAYFHAQGYTPAMLAARKAEPRPAATTSEMQAIRDAADTNFAAMRGLPQPRVPATALLSTRFDPTVWQRSPCQPRACQENWIRFRSRWLRAYLDGTLDRGLVTSSTGGHYLQVDEPMLVIAAIRRVLEPLPR